MEDIKLSDILFFILASFTASMGISINYYPDNDLLNQTFNVFATYCIFLLFFIVIVSIFQIVYFDIEENRFVLTFINIFSFLVNYFILYGILLAGIESLKIFW